MRILTNRGCHEGASDGQISSHGSLYYLLKHNRDTVPYRSSRKRGLGWKSGDELFYFSIPDMLIQELIAATIKKKWRKK